MKTLILNTYGLNAVNIFDELAEADGTIKPMYDSGDGIHLNDAGHYYIYEEIIGTGITSTGSFEDMDQSNLPAMLLQNYPNPVSTTTIFPVFLQKPALVEINIYSIDGKLVSQVTNSWFDEGYHSINWHSGSIPSGLYLYRATFKTQSGNIVSSRLMSIMR